MPKDKESEVTENVSRRDLDWHIWLLMSRARDSALELRKRELSQYDITTMNAAVLFILDTIGKRITITDLARNLFRKHHTMSTLVTRMEKQALVKKVKGPRNIVWVSITNKGRQVYQQSIKRESISRAFSDLNEDELNQLAVSLEKIIDRTFVELRLERDPFLSSPFSD